MIEFWMDGEKYELENFTLAEARCHGEDHDCGLTTLDPSLLWRLDIVRIKYDMPIIVTSWTRCKTHNDAVGGSPTSKHIKGRACDLKTVRGGSMALLRQICKDVFPYTKDYPGHIHCDVR